MKALYQQIESLNYTDIFLDKYKLPKIDIWRNRKSKVTESIIENRNREKML